MPSDPIHLDAQRKVVVVMLAYNAERTLKITRELGIGVLVHSSNYGYGGNQKTCFTETLKCGITTIAMLHPDYQYDPRLVPRMVEPIERDEADVVFGSRMLAVTAYRQGMPEVSGE